MSIPSKSCVCVESDGCEALFVHEHISTNTHRCVLQPGGVHRERETEELLQHIRPHCPRVGKVHC